MDFIEGLPKSEDKELILVVVDRLTKFSHFVGLSHPLTAVTVAKMFLDQVHKLHGLLESIISDRDYIFLSSFWQELFKLLETKLQFSSTYHPLTNGQTERFNSYLETYLRCMVGHRPKNWHHWLSLAEWWFNTHYHSRLKMTHFHLLYGYPPPLQRCFVPVESSVASIEELL